MVLGVEPSETACVAKCKASNGIDKDDIQNVHDELEARLFDKKDELLDDLKEYLLDEDKHPSGDYQSRFEDMCGKWDDDIASVDFEKVKADSRTMLQDIDEWVHSLDLTSLRQDGEKQVNYYRKYIEDYRTIKDDFIDGSIGDFLQDYLGVFKTKSGIKGTAKDAESTLKTNGFNQITKNRKNKVRFKALVNECKTRFEEIKDERQSDYEELKEKYKDVHEDIKSKKRHWKELMKKWRRNNDDEEDEEEDDELKVRNADK